MSGAALRVAPPADGAGTLGALLRAARGRLHRAGIESARLDARLLAGLALGWDGAGVLTHPEHCPTPGEQRRFEALLRRRVRREPMAYIAGRREFWGLDFLVTKHTLVPRPDSETLIQAALESVGGRSRALRVLDLGTGSGCLVLALLAELTNARGLGVDVSDAALAVARDNADRLDARAGLTGIGGRARFRRSDWGAGVGDRFDLVVANPPYVADGEFLSLEPEVARFEPRLALAGGPDGLRCFGAMAPGLGRLLAPGGLAFVEIGAGQERAVGVIFRQHGLEIVRVHRDLASRPRVIEARVGARPAI